MSPIELIGLLKEQHQLLRQDLSNVSVFIDEGRENDYEKIHTTLVAFGTRLTEHIELEDSIFYPGYIKKKEERGENVSAIIPFVREMEGCSKKVLTFLQTYHSPEVISTSVDSFRKDLHEVISVLSIRIYTEEDGLFDIYTAM